MASGGPQDKTAALKMRPIVRTSQLEPKNITAFMLGLTSRKTTFRVQRDIKNYSNEPLTAILLGVAVTNDGPVEKYSAPYFWPDTGRRSVGVERDDAGLYQSAQARSTLAQSDRRAPIVFVVRAASIIG